MYVLWRFRPRHFAEDIAKARLDPGEVNTMANNATRFTAVIE